MVDKILSDRRGHFLAGCEGNECPESHLYSAGPSRSVRQRCRSTEHWINLVSKRVTPATQGRASRVEKIDYRLLAGARVDKIDPAKDGHRVDADDSCELDPASIFDR